MVKLLEGETTTPIYNIVFDRLENPNKFFDGLDVNFWANPANKFRSEDLALLKLATGWPDGLRQGVACDIYGHPTLIPRAEGQGVLDRIEYAKSLARVLYGPVDKIEQICEIQNDMLGNDELAII